MILRDIQRVKRVRDVLAKIEEDVRIAERRVEEAVNTGTAQSFLISETQREMSQMYVSMLRKALDE